MKKLVKPISIVLTIAYLLLIPISALAAAGEAGAATAGSLLSKWQDYGLVDESINNSDLNNSIQKIDFIKLINGIMKPTKKAGIGFIDVPEGSWYGEEISRAIAAGYIDNKEKAKFNPFSDITRLEAAIMVKRVFGLELKDKRILSKINDAETLSSEELNAFGAVVEKGCLTEVSEGRYAPTGVLKLSDALKMLDICAGQVVIKSGTISNYVSGNMLINTGAVTLKDMDVSGDMTIGEGVGDGDVRLDGVKVGGKLVIRGGGPNSVILTNTRVNDYMVIDKSAGNVHIKASGTTTIDETYVKSGCYLEENGLTSGKGFVDITAEKSTVGNQKFDLKGDYNKLTVNESNLSVNLSGNTDAVEISKGAAGNLTLSAGSVKTITTKASQNIIEILGGTVTNLNIDTGAIGNKLTVNGNATVSNFNVKENTDISLIKGTVDKLTLESASEGSKLDISSGAYLKNLTANAAATITGSGSITNAYLYAPSVSMSIKPSGDYIRSGSETTTPGSTGTDTTLPKLTITNVYNKTIMAGSNNQKLDARASNGAEIFYSSSDNSIVTVGEKGQLTGVSVGTANVYISAVKEGFAPAVSTITVNVISGNTTSAGTLEVSPSSGNAGEIKDITITYTAAENMTSGRIVIKLPAGFTASENDKFSINSGTEAALTKAQIIDAETLSFNNIAVASGNTVRVILKNKEIPTGGQFEFSAVVDTDGMGPRLPAGEVSCIFTCDSLKTLQGNGVNYTTPEYGSETGKTKISALSFVNIYGATKWIISNDVTVPKYDDVIAGTEYAAGQDIAVTGGQQLLLAAVDAGGRVKAYAVIVIDASMIRPDDAAVLDPATIEVEPGIQAGTVRLTGLDSGLPSSATAWMFKIQSAPSPAVLIDSVFDGTDIYTSGTDLKVTENQYIVLAAVDNETDKHVKAYASIPVAGMISQPAGVLTEGTNYSKPENGSEVGKISIKSLTPGNYGITGWQYVVLDNPAVIPAINVSTTDFEKYTGTQKFNSYEAPGDISADDGKHILLVGTDTENRILAYSDIFVETGTVRREDAPLIPSTNVIGPVMGSAEGTISVTTNFSTPIAGATKYKYRFQDTELKPAPQINSKSDMYSELEKDLMVTAKYLVLVATDNSGLIKAYMNIEITDKMIRPADAYLLKVANGEYTVPVQGTTVGAISLSLNETKIETDIGKQVSQWWYKLSDKDFGNPYTGSDLTGSMTPYVPGNDIGNVSPLQYLLIIGVDGNGTLVYLKERIQYDQIKQPDSSVLKSSDEISSNFNYSVPEPGDKAGQTKIKTLSFWGINGAYVWEYKTSDTAVVPGYNTSAVGTSAYNFDQSITVDKKYLVLYAVDDHNNKRIKAYANIPINDIQKRVLDLTVDHNYKIATGSTKGTVAIPFLSFADLGGTAPYTGWSWKYSIGNAKFGVPGRGTKASDIPGITDFVPTTPNITVADGQYLLLVAVDENGLVKAFANILIGSGVSNPGDAELIPPGYYLLTKGSVEGTTRFDVLNMGISGQTKWAYAVKDTVPTTPVKKDALISTLGAKDLDPTKDIQVKYGQCILLLATDKDNKVKGYAYISVAEDQIQAPFAVDLITKTATYSGPSKGNTAGSSKISLRITNDIPKDKDGTIIWKYKIGTSPFSTPHLNDDASAGSGYIAYTSNDDIMVKEGEYLLIAAVSKNPDGSERVKAYLKFTMKSDWIRPAEVTGLESDNYKGPYPGSEPGTTKLTDLQLFDLTNCQWKVKVSDTDDKIFVDTQFAGATYIEGDNIAVKQGQFVVLAAVDRTSGKVKAYKNILIDNPSYLNAPGLKAGDNYAEPKWGSREGTTSVYVSPKGLAGNIVFVAKVTNEIENIVADSQISYTSPAAIEYNTFKAYTANTDIAVKAGQYILLAAVDADSKKIVAYRNIAVTEANIMPEGADTLVVNVNYMPLQPGTDIGNTKLPLIGFDGVIANTWLVKVVAAPITAVALDSVDSDAKAYVSNADIPAKPGDFVILYAANKVGTEPYKIKAFACIPVDPDDIRGAAPELVINSAPEPGTLLNTTSVKTSDVVLPAGATMIRYIVGSSSAGTIIKDSKMSDLPVYTPGGNITANEGQYLVFVATDDSGYVKAVSKETKLTADMIKNVVLTLGGTVFPAVSEADIATGGNTIILTLDSAEWADNAITTNKSVLLGSFIAATENDKWKTVMGKVTMIQKSDDGKAITIKLSESTYDITANQKITVTIPAKLIKGAVNPVTAKETINIAAVSNLGVALMNGATSVTSFSQNDIKAGTAKIIITLAGGGKFVSDVDTATEKKNAILNGLKATYNTVAWANVLSKATLTQNSDSKLTITLKDTDYEPLGNEVISVTIPAKVSSGYIIDGAVNDAAASTKITIYSNISAALSGTLVSAPVTEGDIVAGNKTLVITLANGKWVSDIVSNETVRNALFAGISPTVSTNDTNSWKNNVLARLTASDIKVNSETEIVITLPAATGYAISADQNIVVNIPSACIAGGIKDKLVAAQSIKITNIAPAVAAVVKNVSVVGSTTEFKLGDKILINVEFDTSVDVTGAPTITLNTGKTAVYKAKAAANILTFEYTVVSGDNTTKLDYQATSPLKLNSGTIKNGETNVSLVLPAPGKTGSLGDPLKTPIVVDAVAPTFTTALKQTTTQAETTADITFKINDTGKVYYVVMVNSGTSTVPPTAQQIVDWNTTPPDSVVAHGIVNASANVVDTIHITTGLSSNTTYNVYAIAEDALQNRSGVTSCNVQTIDKTPPMFTVPPTGVTPSDYSVSLVVNTNEIGNIYVVAVAEGSAAPINSDVKSTYTAAKVKQAVTTDTVNKDITLNITKFATSKTAAAQLVPSTNYDIYVVCEDAKGNLSASMMVDAKTIPLDLTKVDVDLANNKLLNTNTLMQYSVNGGDWKDCDPSTTAVTFNYTDNTEFITVQIKEKNNPDNPKQTITLSRGDDTTISRSMIDYNIAKGEMANKSGINLEFRINGGAWQQLKVNTSVSGVIFEPGDLDLRIAATSPTAAGSRDAKLPSKPRTVDGISSESGAPALTANDSENKIDDIKNIHEYSVNGGGWISGELAVGRTEDFVGTKTVLVRFKATASQLPSKTKELKFTANTFTAAAKPAVTTGTATAKATVTLEFEESTNLANQSLSAQQISDWFQVTSAFGDLHTWGDAQGKFSATGKELIITINTIGSIKAGDVIKFTAAATAAIKNANYTSCKLAGSFHTTPVVISITAENTNNDSAFSDGERLVIVFDQGTKQGVNISTSNISSLLILTDESGAITKKWSISGSPDLKFVWSADSTTLYITFNKASDTELAVGDKIRINSAWGLTDTEGTTKACTSTKIIEGSFTAP